MKGGYVYIITNKNNTVLYTGVTSNLYARINQHRDGVNPGFTKRYNCKKLVYWEFLETITSAIHREKRLKKYTRLMKENLINQMNPEWDDLYDSIEEMQ
ncbi:putative endonuclease [Marinoscillum furvescens DSM 4134]|uniref:Putative endonuclease n=2 Tax=Marinoscillum furvescens TaxID=1026 RepID=A0A3D9L098_MARFU|nr:putative endonuclease [Marinoscillum furvescens DSM 4134]